jgi:predicted nucleic acid-binding Zn ribbon protein
LVLILEAPKRAAVRKSKDIKGLFEGGSERLTSLKARIQERSRVLDLVIAALPKELAPNVATAGVDRGVLIVGAVSAAWATRLRYQTEPLRLRVGEALGVEIERVRIKVVTATAAPRKSPNG